MGEGEPEPVQELQKKLNNSEKENLTLQLQAIQKDYSASARFKMMLGVTELLPALQGAGVLPFLENPNPYDIELEEEQYARWSNENPEEEAKFFEVLKKSEVIQDTFYLGASLRRLSGGRLYRRSTIPAELTSDQLTTFFKSNFENTPGFMIEQAFEHEGISIAALEKIGIVPIASAPPKDFLDWDKVQRRKWYEEHPQYHKREEVLKCLHIGAFIDRLLDKSFKK